MSEDELTVLQMIDQLAIRAAATNERTPAGEPDGGASPEVETGDEARLASGG